MYNSGQLVQYDKRNFLAYGSGTAITNIAIIPFTIPREANFISFTLVGPGGGGAGGVTGAITTSRRGGGGGGAGATTCSIFPSKVLPSTIFLYLPGGGSGGAANTSGTTSQAANVLTTVPISTTINVATLLVTAAAGALGNVSGAGGAGGAASTTTGYNGLAIGRNSIAGATGSASGTAAATTNNTLTAIVQGGCGGGSTNLGTAFAGGALTTGNVNNIFATSLTTSVISAAGAINGGAGANGFDNFLNSKFNISEYPFISTCGGGGGSIDSGTGGAGGFSGLGSGGSGGGAGTTGGRGGDGGASFCLIKWW